jgi:hypothetical protein
MSIINGQAGRLRQMMPYDIILFIEICKASNSWFWSKVARVIDFALISKDHRIDPAG